MDRRFPPAPGAHVVCANKSVTIFRPKEGSLQEGQANGVWSYIALSIARDRDTAADLFIEDAGLWARNDNPDDLRAFLEEHRRSVAWSIVACGEDQSALYDRTYIAFAYTIMKPGEVGTALTVAPYITLATDETIMVVQCMFKADPKAPKAGKRITIKGRCDGGSGNVLLRECVVE